MTTTTTTADFISRHQAALRFGVTRARLALASTSTSTGLRS